MPSITHEGLLQPFQDRPELAAELLVDALGIEVPDWEQAQLWRADLTDLVPTEFRADAVIKLYRDGAVDKPVQAVIVEVQKDPNERKRYAWPVYLSTLRARLECPAKLLVIAKDASIATWCAKPIDLGHPDWVLTPLVLGPNQIPVVADPLEAERTPELTLLSTLMHGATHPKRKQILETFVGTLENIKDDRADTYADAVAAALPEAARLYLEKLMTATTYKFRSEFAIRHISRGMAEALLGVLAGRNIDVPEPVRERIINCKDREVLSIWVRRAATIDSVNDLFIS